MNEINTLYLGNCYSPGKKPCKDCGSQHGHLHSCAVFFTPVEFTAEDQNQLRKDADTLEIIARTVVSPEIAAECRKELAQAALNNYRLPKK